MKGFPVSDIAVIGGGIVGSSVAYNAARAGLSVTVIDRGDEGHATAAGAGIISPGVGHRHDRAHNTLMAQAGSYYPRLIAELAEDGELETGYDVVGAILVAMTAEEVPGIDAAYHFAQEALAAGVEGVGEVRRIGSLDAQTLFPPLASVHAALHITGTARIDGRLMRAALQRAAVRRGAVTLQGDATITADAAGRATVQLDGEPLAAEAIVIAAGAWSAPLAQQLNCVLPVAPQRGQIAHLAIPETNTSRWPVVLPFQGHYLLTFPENRVVVGATRETGTGFDYRLTAGGVHEVLSQALRVAPGLSPATLHEVRIGFRPVSADGLPILGRAPGWENVYFATGHGPSGLTLGPHAGAIIVDLIRGEPDAFDLGPYVPERFQES
jgi:D-amino-acid dehydrogenase